MHISLTCAALDIAVAKQHSMLMHGDKFVDTRLRLPLHENPFI